MRGKNIGSSFDDFLLEEAMLEVVTAVALKRIIARQIAEEMKAQRVTQAQLAAHMHTSRAALNRLLDENDPELTLTTLIRAVNVLGLKVDIRLHPNKALRKSGRENSPSFPSTLTCEQGPELHPQPRHQKSLGLNATDSLASCRFCIRE